MIITVVGIGIIVGSITVAYAAETRHDGRLLRSSSKSSHKHGAHCYRVRDKRERVCPRKHAKKKTDPKHPLAVLPKPTTPSPVPPPATPSQPAAPVCPQNAPLPTPVPGQTTIVGYATLDGGPAPQPSSCPPGQESEGGAVVLETSAGQTIETQTVSAGQAYQFVVQPGSYLVADSTCMDGIPVKAAEGQQNRADVGCDIP
jgi:hypothetical protein